MSWAGCQSQTLAMGREIPVRHQEQGRKKSFFFSHLAGLLAWGACLPRIPMCEGVMGWAELGDGRRRTADGGTRCGCHLCALSEWLAGCQVRRADDCPFACLLACLMAGLLRLEGSDVTWRGG